MAVRLLCRKEAKRLLFRYLLFSYFIQSLAVYAEGGGGTRFETFETDFHTATFAIAVIAGVYFCDRFINFLDQLALAVTITQFQRHIRFLTGAIVRISKNC